jgi:hypothetical protein
MPARVTRVSLVVVDAFAAVSAIGGGLALVAGLEGDRFPLRWLTGTPFSSYTLPGWLLAVLVGGSAAIAAVAAITYRAAGANASVVAGVIMLGWIVGEVVILNQPTRPTMIEVLYASVGVVMVLLGWVVSYIPRSKADA